MHVGEGRRFEALVLVTLGHVDGRCHRELQPCRCGLRVIVLLVLPDEKSHYPIRLGLLYARDDLAKFGYRERHEFFGDNLATDKRSEGFGPGCRQLPEIVVCG